MFTIKIKTDVRHQGNSDTPPHTTTDEQVFEAAGVRKEGSKIYVDMIDSVGEYDTSMGATNRESVMYVMNRFGATVATYRL